MSRHWLFAAAAGIGAVLLAASGSLACPFCTALAPTLTERREEARRVVVARLESMADGHGHFAVLDQLWPHDDSSGPRMLRLPLEPPLDVGGQFLLFGNDDKENPGERTWTIEPTDEIHTAYFSQAPGRRTRAEVRLAYFIPFLEHEDSRIAEDAWQEMGHASFAEVATLGDRFPMDRFRRFLDDPQVRAEHKGFYGMALGLARAEEDRRANREILRAHLDQPSETSFRVGFDGLLGGYLLLDGEGAVEALEERYFSKPDARDGDVRHALSAFRFYIEYGTDPPVDRIRSAVRRLLERPEFAPEAIIDLARWQDWEATKLVADCYDRAGYPQPGTRRAVVGYLSTCTTPEGARVLGELRKKDPKGVKEAETFHRLFGGGRSLGNPDR